MDTILSTIQNGIIPVDMSVIKNEYNPEIRNAITREECMWAAVDLNWTKDLADRIRGKTVLEVMAGRGWLAKALHFHGIDIIASDDQFWEAAKKEPVFNVEKLDAVNAVKKYSDRDVLICSWNPWGDIAFNECIKIWKGDIIYIGEHYGCTGDDSMWELASILDTMDIPQWPGIHDDVYFLKSV